MTTATDVRPAWQCAGCGRVSQASHKPQHHWRHGEHCGPFTAATIGPDGAVLAPAGATVVQHEPPAPQDPALRYRQSRLRSYVTCPRRTILASEHTTGTVGSSADLGSAFHAVAAEIRRTLRDPTRRLRRGEPLPNYITGQGESQMSTEEAVAIMREVVNEGSWILTPADYAGDGNSPGLVGMVCNFAAEKWRPERFMAIEQRLSMEILCPDGEIRLFTGTPDVVTADPDSEHPGLVIEDDKTVKARPQNPKQPPPSGQPVRGAQYLHEHGYFQLIGYGALCSHEWPRAQRFTLKEKNWRWPGPPRELTITRDYIREHVIPYLGLVMMQLDQGLREGEGSEFAKPRSGAQCRTRCSVALTCPIPAEQRGLGALSSRDAADAAAARWVVVRALDAQLRAALKAVVDDDGDSYHPKVGDGREVRWQDKPSGKGRDFGPFDPPANGEAQQRADEAFVGAAITGQAADPEAADAFVASLEAELAKREKAPVAS